MSKPVLDFFERAAAAKLSMDKLSAAQHLEAAAALLRKEAGKPVAHNFRKEAMAKKESRLDKIFAAMASTRNEKIDQVLAPAGWKLSSVKSPDGSDVYYNTSKQGYQIYIKENKFSARIGNEIVQPKTELASLGEYIQRLNKKP